MATFNPPAPLLPQYRHAPAEPSRLRRTLVVGGQLVAAAGYGVAAVTLPPALLTILIAPVVVCLLLALWMMPDRGVFPLGAIQRVYVILLVLMVIWPSYIAVVLPGLPWLTPTRVALFIVTFFFLYSLSTSGLLRRHVYTVARVSKPLWIAFLFWQASMIYTVPFSPTPASTLKFLLDNELRLTEMFFLGCLLFLRPGAATRTIGWLIVLGLVCSLDGFVEVRLEYPPWAFHIPSFMRVDDATLANVLGAQARSADGLYRVRGPFPNSLIFAEYLALCTPFILHWIITGRSLLLRLAMIVAWFTMFAAILTTQSRLGLVGALFGHVAYLPLWAFRRWRADRSALLGPFILFGAPFAALLTVGIIFSSHTLATRILGGGAQAASNAARAQQRAMAVPKVLANPIGHGLGQSGNVLGFANQAGAVTVDNHYITSLIDVGVPGTIAFYAMFIIAASLGVRLYLSTRDREVELAGPLAVMFIVFFLIKTVLSQENNHALVLLLLGMMVALWARDKGIVRYDDLLPGTTARADQPNASAAR